MRGTRGLHMVAMALILCACEPVAAPPTEPPPSPTLPATPVEPGVALLRAAHEAMSESAFSFGGMQEWGRAVTQLDEAVPLLASDTRFAAVAAELQAFLPRAREILTEQQHLQECNAFMRDSRQGREADPERYDACWLRYMDSKARRRALHDEAAALLQRVELAR